jgi:hypothetical protein
MSTSSRSKPRPTALRTSAFMRRQHAPVGSGQPVKRCQGSLGPRLDDDEERSRCGRCGSRPVRGTKVGAIRCEPGAIGIRRALTSRYRSSSAPRSRCTPWLTSCPSHSRYSTVSPGRSTSTRFFVVRSFRVRDSACRSRMGPPPSFSRSGEPWTRAALMPTSGCVSASRRSRTTRTWRRLCTRPPSGGER